MCIWAILTGLGIINNNRKGDHEVESVTGWRYLKEFVGSCGRWM